MKVTLLMQLLLDSKHLFSKGWLATNAMFFHEDHLYKFSKNCIGFHENGISKDNRLPYFSEEKMANLEDSFSFFKKGISEINSGNFISNTLAFELGKNILIGVMIVSGERLKAHH